MGDKKMRKAIEFIKPTQIKIVPVVTLIVFNFFLVWTMRWIPPDYLWRSLVMHIPIAYFLTCLFIWFAYLEKKHLLMLTGFLALVFLVVSLATNFLFYKEIVKIYPTLSLSEIEPTILSFNLRWNVGLFIFLTLLCSSYMGIYLYALNKKRREELNSPQESN